MPDFDLEAAAAARDRYRESLPRDVCGMCQRPMFQEPPFPGVPSEWRHVSSGHPLSWTPEKHLASRTTVFQHSHRFEPVEGSLDRCSVNGCDSEMPPRTKHAVPEPVTEKEAALMESRKRGAVRGSRTANAKRAIPF